MALLMVFEDKAESTNDFNIFVRNGFRLYRCHNIYQFLRYAKEAKPDIVMMNFSQTFQNDAKTMEEIRNHLCEKATCPKIYLNAPKNFDGEKFFQNIDFNSEALERLLFHLTQEHKQEEYKN